MNVVMLPMWLLSGVFFASSNFPDVAQPFIRLLPLTALNDALRARDARRARRRRRSRREIATLTVWGVGDLRPGGEAVPLALSRARPTSAARLGAAAARRLSDGPVEEAEAAPLAATDLAGSAGAIGVERARSARLTSSSARLAGLNSVTPAQQVNEIVAALALVLVLVLERGERLQRRLQPLRGR